MGKNERYNSITDIFEQFVDNLTTTEPFKLMLNVIFIMDHLTGTQFKSS